MSTVFAGYGIDLYRFTVFLNLLRFAQGFLSFQLLAFREYLGFSLLLGLLHEPVKKKTHLQIVILKCVLIHIDKFQLPPIPREVRFRDVNHKKVYIFEVCKFANQNQK